MSIKLESILPIENLHDYKLHLAGWNGQDKPLDVFVRSRKEWESWNKYRGKKNNFNRDFIFSLIDFHHEPDIWLFGGIYKVLSCGPKINFHSYEVELVKNSQELIGRLKVSFERPGRARSLCLENWHQKITIADILREPYTGEVFYGEENISPDFSQLESIYRNDKQDWNAVLEKYKAAEIKARIGQGRFRQQVLTYWGECAVTSCKDHSLLVASHIKPWSECNSKEATDPFNGLLLSPNLDKAFDRGFISFSDKGEIIVSKQFHASDAEALGIDETMKLRKFDKRHLFFLNYHRTKWNEDSSPKL